MKFYIVKHHFFIHSDECEEGMLLKMFDSKHKKDAFKYFDAIKSAEQMYANENGFETEEDEGYFSASDEDGSAIEIWVEERVVNETDDGSFFTISV